MDQLTDEQRRAKVAELRMAGREAEAEGHLNVVRACEELLKLDHHLPVASFETLTVCEVLTRLSHLGKRGIHARRRIIDALNSIPAARSIDERYFAVRQEEGEPK